MRLKCGSRSHELVFFSLPSSVRGGVEEGFLVRPIESVSDFFLVLFFAPFSYNSV